MADATSTVRVNIIGDAKKLSGALKEADKGLGGFGKTLLAGAAAGLSVKAAFDFAGDAVEQADRLGDATQRLELQLGKVDAKKVEDIAGSFLDLGLSSADILELSSNFSDMATATGLADDAIAGFAPKVAATAQAIQLLGGADAATNVDLIGKAAGGSAKAMKELGVNVSEADVVALALSETGKTLASDLTDGEKATARLNLVMDQLKPKLDAVSSGTKDLEQNQAALQARVEELQGKLGGPLSDALSAVVGFINDEVDAIPSAIQGWRSLGAAIEGAARTAAAPLGNVRDLLEDIVRLLPGMENARGPALLSGGSINVGRVGRPSDSATVRAVQRTTERRGGIGNSLGGP